MPFCPNCREEYDAGIAECADCLEPLVDSLDHEAPEEGASASQGQLGGAACPAQNRIDDADCGEEECGSDEIRESDLLDLPFTEILREGEENLDELMQLVIRGTPAVGKRAATLLSLMGGSGIEALQKLVKVALENGRLTTVTIVAGTLRGTEFDPAFWKEFVPYLNNGVPVRIKALELLGHFADLSAFPAILPALDDPDPDVRDEADNTLCVLSDEDMGFDTDAPPASRREKIALWKEWWNRRQAKWM